MIKDDNICAIATGIKTASISVIRVSGKTAINEVNKCFKGKSLLDAEANTITYGYIVDNDQVIDEVLVSVFKNPKSFTMEDMCEISTHGGIFVTNKVLETLLKQDIRLANPGEFTYRAYLNGRIDLVQAEAIKDIIDASSDYELAISHNALKKHASKLVKDLAKKIMDIIISIEVNIEYPEYEDIEQVTNEVLIPRVELVKRDLLNTIKHSNNTKLIKEGIKTVILGRPNVGKSSILNALLGEEKAIVTNIKGTTRDIVEGEFLLGGIKLNLVDTAGIRKTDDKIEKIGVKKSLEQLKNCDLCLLVLNSNQKLTNEDLELLEKTKNIPRIIILNKTDLKTNLKLELNEEYINFSAKKKIGIKELEDLVIKKLNLDEIKEQDYKYLSNTRQISLLNKAYEQVELTLKNLKNNVFLDLLVVDLKTAYNYLEEILGNVYDDDVPRNIFKNFCLGK